jgi:hypothetical protein
MRFMILLMRYFWVIQVCDGFHICVFLYSGGKVMSVVTVHWQTLPACTWPYNRYVGVITCIKLHPELCCTAVQCLSLSLWWLSSSSTSVLMNWNVERIQFSCCHWKLLSTVAACYYYFNLRCVTCIQMYTELRL